VTYKILSALFAFFLLCGCASTTECHLTDDEFEVSSQEEFEQWYAQYKRCERSPDVSSDVLFGLALAIGWAEIDGYPANRPEHIYDLIYRAAKMGNQEALIDLARFFEIGFDEAGISANYEIFRCLDDLAEIAPEGDSDFSIPVGQCLAAAD